MAFLLCIGRPYVDAVTKLLRRLSVVCGTVNLAPGAPGGPSHRLERWGRTWGMQAGQGEGTLSREGGGFVLVPLRTIFIGGSHAEHLSPRCLPLFLVPCRLPTALRHYHVPLTRHHKLQYVP